MGSSHRQLHMMIATPTCKRRGRLRLLKRLLGYLASSMDGGMKRRPAEGNESCCIFSARYLSRNLEDISKRKRFAKNSVYPITPTHNLAPSVANLKFAA